MCNTPNVYFFVLIQWGVESLRESLTPPTDHNQQRPLHRPAAMGDATATAPQQATMPSVPLPGPDDILLQLAFRPVTPPTEGLSHHDRAFASDAIETILRWHLELREDRAIKGVPHPVRPYLCVRPVTMVRALIAEAVGAAGQDNMMLYVLACIMTAFMNALPETLRLSDVTQFFADHAVWSAASGRQQPTGLTLSRCTTFTIFSAAVGLPPVFTALRPFGRSLVI